MAVERNGAVRMVECVCRWLPRLLLPPASGLLAVIAYWIRGDQHHMLNIAGIVILLVVASLVGLWAAACWSMDDV